MNKKAVHISANYSKTYLLTMRLEISKENNQARFILRYSV
jgi:hypothetical protein